MAWCSMILLSPAYMMSSGEKSHLEFTDSRHMCRWTSKIQFSFCQSWLSSKEDYNKEGGWAWRSLAGLGTWSQACKRAGSGWEGARRLPCRQSWPQSGGRKSEVKGAKKACWWDHFRPAVLSAYFCAWSFWGDYLPAPLSQPQDLTLTAMTGYDREEEHVVLANYLKSSSSLHKLHSHTCQFA